MSKRSSPTDALTGSASAAAGGATGAAAAGAGGAGAPEPTVAKRTRSAASAATAVSSSGGPSAAQPPAVPTGVTFSTKDSAQQLNYSRGGLEVVGCVGGYRMARATEGVFSGNWYWEAEVLLPGEEEEQQQQQGAGAGQQEEGSGPAPPQQQEEEGGGVAKAEAGDEGGSTVAAAGPSSGGNGDSGSAPHFRMGWALRQADTQAPCGYDKNSYGYRDVDGAKVHKSLREDGYGEPYGPGDVIGFGVCLPILPEHMQEISALNGGVLPAYVRGADDESSSARAGAGCVVGGDDALAGSGAGGVLSEDEAAALRQELEALGNHIRFFKNGKDQGPAYSQLIGAKYYPAVSLYNAGGRVRANFGPAWICDPREQDCRIPFRPISALSKEPMKKEELAAYSAYIEGRRAAWRARHAARRGVVGGEGQGQGQGQGQGAEAAAGGNGDAVVGPE